MGKAGVGFDGPLGEVSPEGGRHLGAFGTDAAFQRGEALGGGFFEIRRVDLGGDRAADFLGNHRSEVTNFFGLDDIFQATESAIDRRQFEHFGEAFGGFGGAALFGEASGLVGVFAPGGAGIGEDLATSWKGIGGGQFDGGEELVHFEAIRDPEEVRGDFTRLRGWWAREADGGWDRVGIQRADAEGEDGQDEER